MCGGSCGGYLGRLWCCLLFLSFFGFCFLPESFLPWSGDKVLKPGKVVSEKASATVDKFGQKIKKAFDKPAKKAAGSKTAKSESQ